MESDCKTIAEAMANVVNGYTILAPIYETTLRSTYMVSPNEIDSFFNGIRPRSIVLDVGCGPGIESRVGANRGHQMIGMDITERMVERYRQALPNAQTIIGDMTCIPLANGSVDAVFVASSLMHVNGTLGTRAITEFARISRKGAALFIATMLETGREEFHSRATLTQAGVESLYFFYWDPQVLRQTLMDAGYRIDSWQEKELVANRPRWVFMQATLNR